MRAKAKKKHSPSREVIDQRYRILKRLGQGRYGLVYAVEDLQSKHSFALKIFNDRETEALHSEFHALQSVSHPNIVQVYELAKHILLWN